MDTHPLNINKLEENNNEAKLLSNERHQSKYKEKTFHPRESMLTHLFTQTEMSIVYNFSAGVFVLFFLRALIDDIFTYGLPFHHTWLIWWNFSKFPQTMAVWGLMFGSTLIPYVGLKLWANVPEKKVTVPSSTPWLLALSAYLFSLFYFPLRFLFAAELNCACSFIITCETTRLAMKIYAFVRENVPRGIEKKMCIVGAKPGESSIDWPSVEQFLYYQFCPSFIYRDEYPRTEKSDWRKAGFHFVHCLLLIEFVNLVFTQWVEPALSGIDYPNAAFSTSLLHLFSSILPGVICLISLFYGLLHSWLNLFSEILTYADRHFYDNWWNSNNMAEYYRNWNLVVHDWLYNYVYRDIAVLIGGKRGKLIAQMCVFFLSSVFHEYWFGVAFRCFYPVMFLLYFVFGGVFFFVSRTITNRHVWNTALWFNLLIGTGMFVAFYGQEWYARRGHCAPRNSSFLDALLPRHWSCQTPKI
ncbi:unnamed protein product, partial [Mesorhabditis belari]|uniref:O-acyltransferase n=1 Tax=Mesorhabditis belari TaxID=2138241 RepID=A0AAF3FKX4_9BILA